MRLPLTQTLHGTLAFVPIIKLVVMVVVVMMMMMMMALMVMRTDRSDISIASILQLHHSTNMCCFMTTRAILPARTTAPRLFGFFPRWTVVIHSMKMAVLLPLLVAVLLLLNAGTMETAKTHARLCHVKLGPV
jgi:hypothetical protein